MQQQPAVQPVMQALLQNKLPNFLANVFQILNCGLRCEGKQRAQACEGAFGSFCVSEPLASSLRMFKIDAHL